MSAERNLVTADKPDSQEICFIPNNNYRTFLEKVAPGMAQPGEMVDTAGNVVGSHSGVPNYTIGQRKGLGALGPEPRFVLELRPADNKVIVGSNEELLSAGLVADDAHWVNGEPAETPFRAN